MNVSKKGIINIYENELKVLIKFYPRIQSTEFFVKLKKLEYFSRILQYNP